MAEFLTTNGTSLQIENIIKEAKENLYLVSPYLQITNNFFERLSDADEKSIIITLIYHKNKLQDADRKKLYSLRNLNLYFSKNLHAKCYCNEKKMIITSMNMYEYSEKTNREMGILLDRYKDKLPFIEALEEIQSIIKNAEKERESQKKDNIVSAKETINYNTDKKHNIHKEKSNYPLGYCIRCRENIRLNPNTPYCSSCFGSWKFYENPFFEEKFCHRCGFSNTSSMDKPLCYSCFKEMITL